MHVVQLHLKAEVFIHVLNGHSRKAVKNLDEQFVGNFFTEVILQVCTEIKKLNKLINTAVWQHEKQLIAHVIQRSIRFH